MRQANGATRYDRGPDLDLNTRNLSGTTGLGGSGDPNARNRRWPSRTLRRLRERSVRGPMSGAAAPPDRLPSGGSAAAVGAAVGGGLLQAGHHHQHLAGTAGRTRPVSPFRGDEHDHDQRRAEEHRRRLTLAEIRGVVGDVDDGEGAEDRAEPGRLAADDQAGEQSDRVEQGERVVGDEAAEVHREQAAAQAGERPGDAERDRLDRGQVDARRGRPRSRCPGRRSWPGRSGCGRCCARPASPRSARRRESQYSHWPFSAQREPDQRGGAQHRAPDGQPLRPRR